MLHGVSKNFQCQLLKPERIEKIKLKSKKFGIIYHIEGEVGRRIFHVRRYEVPKQLNNSDVIQIRSEGEEINVVLVIDEGPNGEEVDLEEIESKTYYEGDRTGKMTLTEVVKSGGSVLEIIGGLLDIVTSFIDIA